MEQHPRFLPWLILVGSLLASLPHLEHSQFKHLLHGVSTKSYAIVEDLCLRSRTESCTRTKKIPRTDCWHPSSKLAQPPTAYQHFAHLCTQHICHPMSIPCCFASCIALKPNMQDQRRFHRCFNPSGEAPAAQEAEAPRDLLKGNKKRSALICSEWEDFKGPQSQI